MSCFGVKHMFDFPTSYLYDFRQVINCVWGLVLHLYGENNIHFLWFVWRSEEKWYIKCSVQCPHTVSVQARKYLLTCNKNSPPRSTESSVTWTLLVSAHLIWHLTSSHLILYSLCSSHHRSVPKRTMPTHAHLRTLALAVPVWMFFCLLLGFLCHWFLLSILASGQMSPFSGDCHWCSLPPFLVIYYCIIDFIFFVMLITIWNDRMHTFIYLSIVFNPSPDVSCMRGGDSSNSMGASTTFRVFHTQLVLSEHFLNKLN